MSHASDFAKLSYTFNLEFEAYLETHLAPTLTASQLIVLEFLEQNQHSKPSDLIDFMKSTPAAVTTLLDRMQKANLIVRTKDEHDKRIVRLSITSFGADEIKRGQEVRETFMQNQFNALSTHNQQMLVYLFGKVAKFD
jgi:DNA-binding MarR family transcriptional regulator